MFTSVTVGSNPSDFQPPAGRNQTPIALAPGTNWFRQEDTEIETNHKNTPVKLFMHLRDGFKILMLNRCWAFLKIFIHFLFS